MFQQIYQSRRRLGNVTGANYISPKIISLDVYPVVMESGSKLRLGQPVLNSSIICWAL